MSTQHTPPPLEVRIVPDGKRSRFYIVEAHTSRIVGKMPHVFDLNDQADIASLEHQEERALAQMFAAAPDMLAALREITLLSYTYPKLSWKAWLIKANEIANAAIARAEGKP